MAAIPRYLIGRHLTALVITPQTIAANGTLSDGTPSTITAVAKSVRYSPTRNPENITPVNTTRANNVPIEDDATLTVAIIEVNNGNDPSPLTTAFMTADVFKVSWTKGTGASARVWTGYFCGDAVDDGIEGKGEQIATLTLKQVDAGADTIAREVVP